MPVLVVVLIIVGVSTAAALISWRMLKVEREHHHAQELRTRLHNEFWSIVNMINWNDDDEYDIY